MNLKIYIASDHGGFELKQKIYNQLTEVYTLIDLGPYELLPEDDYPDYAETVAKKMQETENSLGILICRSGNGMVIAANKFKGIYAALCFSKHHAEMARKDDNANVICIDADYEGDDPIEIIRKFIETEFAGATTRHGRRFRKIQSIEENVMR